MANEHRTPHEVALRYAREFVAEPDKRAQVKVALAVAGYPQLADMIDEAVAVSIALLETQGLLGAANNALGHQAALLSEKDRQFQSAVSEKKEPMCVADQPCPTCGQKVRW